MASRTSRSHARLFHTNFVQTSQSAVASAGRGFAAFVGLRRSDGQRGLVAARADLATQADAGLGAEPFVRTWLGRRRRPGTAGANTVFCRGVETVRQQ